MEDIPAVHGAVAPQGAWAAVDHAPMTRTAQSRLNNRRHQGRRRLRHNQRQAAQLQLPSQRLPVQPSFMQRNPLLAGIAGGIAGSWIGHMLFGATDSSARTNDAGEQVGQTDQTAGASSSTGILLILMLLGAGAFYYFLKVRRSPTPDFSGIARSSTFSGTLLAQSLPPQPYAQRQSIPRSPPLTNGLSATADRYSNGLEQTRPGWVATVRHAGNAGIFQHRLGRTDQSGHRESCGRCGAPPRRGPGILDRRCHAVRDGRASLECPRLHRVLDEASEGNRAI